MKLSKRVRASSEAAPWVIMEIEKLEAALEEALAQVVVQVIRTGTNTLPPNDPCERDGCVRPRHHRYSCMDSDGFMLPRVNSANGI